MSPVEEGISQVKIALANSHLVKKYSVLENVDNLRPRVDIKIKFVSILDDINELTRMLRTARKKIPGNYIVKIRIETIL